LETIGLAVEPYATFHSTVDFAGRRFSLDTHAWGGDALRRVLSCFIIANLPAEGGEEAFSTLRSTFDFYLTRRPHTPEPFRLVRGAGGSHSDRPPLAPT